MTTDCVVYFVVCSFILGASETNNELSEQTAPHGTYDINSCVFDVNTMYMDRTCFSMHEHLQDPEGGVVTRVWMARILTTPERSSRCKCIRKTCLIVIIA